MKLHSYSLTEVKDLIPYVNNSRTHSDEQVSQIASSIKEFGFTNPVLVDEEGGIIAGHGRVMAAKKLDLDEVPTITLEGLTEAQKKAYIIADNQLPLNAGWDLDTLKLEIETLTELDFDLDLLGFDDGFMTDLFSEEDFSSKNQELDMDDFDDLMELKFKFSSDQYEGVREKLRLINESLEIALLQVLDL